MGVVDHKNCRCNVGHAKESNAEAIRILKFEPTLVIHKVPSFPLVHAIIVFFRNMKSGIHVNSELYIPDCTRSFGRWSAPQRKCFANIFGRCIAQKTCFYTFF